MTSPLKVSASQKQPLGWRPKNRQEMFSNCPTITLLTIEVIAYLRGGAGYAARDVFMEHAIL